MSVIFATVKTGFNYRYIYVLFVIVTWLHLQFLMGSLNQTWQDVRPACIDLTFKVMIRSSQIDHAIKINAFISAATRPMTSKYGRVIDQHALTLPCRSFGFLLTLTGPMITKHTKMVNQHALTLDSRWWWWWCHNH